MNVLDKIREQKEWYDKYAIHYDKFWVEPVSARVVDRWNIKNLKRILREKEVKTVLDLGCGTGKTTREIARLGYRVVSYDISVSMLALARERSPTGLFVKGESSILPFPSHSFDLVVTNGVWHHFADIESTLKEIGRILRSDGILAVLGENNALYKKENKFCKLWRVLRTPRRALNKMLSLLSSGITKPKMTFVHGQSAIPAEPEGTEDIDPIAFTSICRKVNLRELSLYTYDHVPRIENSRFVYPLALELEKTFGRMIARFDGQIIQGFWIKK